MQAAERWWLSDRHPHHNHPDHRRILGLEKWNMVAPPHHINLFTRVALEEMLEHAGFEVLEYSTISTYINFVRSFEHEGPAVPARRCSMR